MSDDTSPSIPQRLDGRGAGIVVEKNIPMPGQGRNCIYPWRAMEVGDSFFVPGKTAREMSAGKSIAQRLTTFKFTQRSVVENEVKGVRIWRTA